MAQSSQNIQAYTTDERLKELHSESPLRSKEDAEYGATNMTTVALACLAKSSTGEKSFHATIADFQTEYKERKCQGLFFEDSINDVLKKQGKSNLVFQNSIERRDSTQLAVNVRRKYRFDKAIDCIRWDLKTNFLFWACFLTEIIPGAEVRRQRNFSVNGQNVSVFGGRILCILLRPHRTCSTALGMTRPTHTHYVISMLLHIQEDWRMYCCKMP